MKKHPFMRLIYFSPVPASDYAQRPHFTVQAWLELGAEAVLWINPYPCRLPRWNDLKRIRKLNTQAAPLDDRITVLDVPALPIEPLPGGAWLNQRILWRNIWRRLTDFIYAGQSTIIGVGKPCALALDALKKLPHRASFYDAMDNFPEFHNGLSRQSTKTYENSIAHQVDSVLASSTQIAEKFSKQGLNVQKVLNAYPMASLPTWQPSRDCPNFRPNENGTVPFNASIITISNHSNDTLGYIGCLGGWFDWPLVIQLAKQLPLARFELVGPQHISPPSNLPPNIHLFPACRQSEAWKHLSRFSLGLIPFRNNALTAGVDPIKYYEYRAAGLPVLSTTFGEMAMRSPQDGVYFLDQTNDFPSLVTKALLHTDDQTSVARFRRENDWSKRFISPSPFSNLINACAKQRVA